MRIRNGFVTNSSSTNYIIISKEELNAPKLVELLGVKKDSIIYNDALYLAQELLRSNGYLNSQYDSLSIEEQIEKIFGEKTGKEYRKATKNNSFVIYGTISDDEAIQSVFALDCKKIKSGNTIIDFTDWGY